MSARRVLTSVHVATNVAHPFFELASGVGMPLASVLGPLPAAAVFGGGSAMVERWAAQAPPSADGRFMVLNGLGVAAVVAHWLGWPRRRMPGGIPWLDECEGLSGRLMLVYNPILYASGLCGALAILRENRSSSRLVALAMGAFVPVLVVLQHGEHRRLLRRAQIRPGWWNRRLVLT